MNSRFSIFILTTKNTFFLFIFDELEIFEKISKIGSFFEFFEKFRENSKFSKILEKFEITFSLNLDFEFFLEVFETNFNFRKFLKKFKNKFLKRFFQNFRNSFDDFRIFFEKFPFSKIFIFLPNRYFCYCFALFPWNI
jgi:hypothetical protein